MATTTSAAIGEIGVTDDGDIIHGLDGDDQIYAGPGNDLIYGGDHSDRIYGSDGDDFLSGGRGADTLHGDYLGGPDGIDTALYANSGAGVLVSLASGEGSGGSAEGDVLDRIENISGSSYDDTLIGDGENNELSGGYGDDDLEGGGGADTLNGDADNDILKGGGGADTLNGGGGGDTLKGGGGADTLNGGNGNDTASCANSADGVYVLLYTDEAGDGDAEGDELNSIENVTGSDHEDLLWGDDGVNVLDGMDGSDTLKGWGGADTLYGGDGSDFLEGMNGSDTLRGENGHDYMDGGSGADTMIGGLGNDIYIVDSQSDTITEAAGQGTDTVRASVSYTLAAGADIETLQTIGPTDTAAINLTGNASGNDIIGNDGHNVLNGGGGQDHMTGHGGNDTYYVDNAGDSVSESGGDGLDTVRTTVSWTLTAGADVETLRTTNDAGVGAINLTGNATGNLVRGNNGNNVINGGNGDDELTGLGGQNSFRFDTALNEDHNIDVIADFDVADDTILLDDDIFSSGLGLGNISAGEFVIGTQALDGNDRIIYDDTTGALYYDNDSAGGEDAVQFATLSTGLALTNFDFLVVA